MIGFALVLAALAVTGALLHCRGKRNERASDSFARWPHGEPHTWPTTERKS